MLGQRLKGADVSLNSRIVTSQLRDVGTAKTFKHVPGAVFAVLFCFAELSNVGLGLLFSSPCFGHHFQILASLCEQMKPSIGAWNLISSLLKSSVEAI